MKSGLNISVTRLENVRQRRMNRIRRQRAIEAGKSVTVSLGPMALNSAQQKEISNFHNRPHVDQQHGIMTPKRVSVMVALGLHLIAVLLGAIYIVSPTRVDAEATIVDIVRSGRTDSRSVRPQICNIGEYHFPRDGCLIPNPNPSEWWAPTPGYEKIRRNAFKPLLEVTTPLLWLKKIEPEYPSEAKSAGKEGRVVLEATIDVDGKAKDIVIKEDAVGFGCARAAIQALKASRFYPAKWGEETVAQRITVPYNFKAEDSSKNFGWEGCVIAPPEHTSGYPVEYHPPTRLTKPPSWLKKIEPEYPIKAKCARKEGKVVLTATIDLDGKAKDIKVKDDDVGFGCARAAIDALEASLFTPAKWGVEIVRFRVAVPYIFKLED